MHKSHPVSLSPLLVRLVFVPYFTVVEMDSLLPLKSTGLVRNLFELVACLHLAQGNGNGVSRERISCLDLKKNS